MINALYFYISALLLLLLLLVMTFIQFIYSYDLKRTMTLERVMLQLLRGC
jgi:hypothetical protein